jgi:hypothetical protein
MMVGYREIDDIERIQELGLTLQTELQGQYLCSEERRIGYPGGNQTRKVFFLEDNGTDSLWYANWQTTKSPKMVTLLGHSQFGSDAWLAIDVQLNYPVNVFSRRTGAAFLEDEITGEIVLAHRGIVTLRQRVAKDKVLEALAEDVIEARVSEKRTDEFVFVTSLSATNIVSNLSRFSRKLRAAVRELGEEVDLDESDDDGEETLQSGNEDGSKGIILRGKRVDALREYFAEFSGARRTFIPKQSFPVSNHGKVVDALNEEMQNREGKTLKSRAIDLVADFEKTALLFEVKTGADTQSIYTAIGQLIVHSPAVSSALDKEVQMVLVLPARPMDLIIQNVLHNLRIRIVTYTIAKAGNVQFFGF